MNRTTELSALERWWNKPSSQLATVWGRRRVGKTALIRKFAADKRSVFHVGAGRAPRSELNQLARGVIAAGLPTKRDLSTRPYIDWDDVFDHFAEMATRERILLVLDEFPELVATTPELPNVIRAFLERNSANNKLRILLCGSAVRHMQGLAEERRPLYGRIDLNVHLHPLAPHEAALMLPKLKPSERAAVYGILGGVPMYLSWWDQSATLAKNLQELVCEPGARLLAEGDLILATEVEAGEYPKAVLHAIATGKTKHSEIEQTIHADPTRTLEKLITLRLVERVQPITETGRTRRKVYRIADNFLAFHLDVVSRHRTAIESGLGATVAPVMMESLDDFQGRSWEVAFRDHLRRMAAQGDLGKDVVGIGPFWTADGANEIDAVVLAGRARTPVLVGEAKWAKSLAAPRLIQNLRQKSRAVPGAPDDIATALCVRDSVRDAPPDVLTVTAADIFDS